MLQQLRARKGAGCLPCYQRAARQNLAAGVKSACTNLAKALMIRSSTEPSCLWACASWFAVKAVSDRMLLCFRGHLPAAQHRRRHESAILYPAACARTLPIVQICTLGFRPGGFLLPAAERPAWGCRGVTAPRSPRPWLLDILIVQSTLEHGRCNPKVPLTVERPALVAPFCSRLFSRASQGGTGWSPAKAVSTGIVASRRASLAGLATTLPLTVVGAPHHFRSAPRRGSCGGRRGPRTKAPCHSEAAPWRLGRC